MAPLLSTAACWPVCSPSRGNAGYITLPAAMNGAECGRGGVGGLRCVPGTADPRSRAREHEDPKAARNYSEPDTIHREGWSAAEGAGGCAARLTFRSKPDAMR